MGIEKNNEFHVIDQNMKSIENWLILFNSDKIRNGI